MTWSVTLFLQTQTLLDGNLLDIAAVDRDGEDTSGVAPDVSVDDTIAVEASSTIHSDNINPSPFALSPNCPPCHDHPHDQPIRLQTSRESWVASCIVPFLSSGSNAVAARSGSSKARTLAVVHGKARSCVGRRMPPEGWQRLSWQNGEPERQNL